MSLYPLYIANEKDRQVWQSFFQALGFLWQYELNGLSIKYQKRETILNPKGGYYFDYDARFRPLLNPPASGQTKFEQAFQWALAQNVDKH